MLTIYTTPITAVLWQGFFTKLYEAAFADDNWKLYLQGIQNTLLLTALSLLLGLLLGVLIASVKYTYQTTGRFSILNKVLSAYTLVVRGTPVMIQLLIVYYIVFGSINLPKILVAGVAFGLNSAAYVSEIIRGGILSVDKGQMEAGRSLGLSYGKTMRRIILPQALRTIVPSLFNEIIALVKETSVAFTISVVDITFAGDAVRAKSYNTMGLIVVALIYLAIIAVLTQIQKLVEKKVKMHA